MNSPVRCAAILAGGASSRMGREKALIQWREKPLISHVSGVLKPIFQRICVVTSKNEVADAADLPAIRDQYEGRGPLSGIHVALSHFQEPTFVVACDMPFLNADFIAFLSRNFDGGILVPHGKSGIEPLHAIYDSSCSSIFEGILRAEGKMPSLRRLVEELEPQIVSEAVARGFDANLCCFSNWNTPADLENGDEAPLT